MLFVAIEHVIWTGLPSAVNDLYSVICYCQGLHPDPDLSGDDDEEGERERYYRYGNVILFKNQMLFS